MNRLLQFDVAQMPRELQRTEAIQAARPERHTPLRAIAQSLSRRGVAGAKVELANSALLAFTETLFDADPDGVTPNVDVDGRVLIPAPWGKSGSRLWQLRVTEGRCLNLIMRQRAQGDALYIYDADGRSWLLGRAYASKRLALAYLRCNEITLGEWRAAWSAVRSTWASRNLDND